MKTSTIGSIAVLVGIYIVFEIINLFKTHVIFGTESTFSFDTIKRNLVYAIISFIVLGVAYLLKKFRK